MNLLVLILILLVLFGGVGFVGPRYDWGAPHYGGVFGIVLLVLLVLLLTGRLRYA